MNTKIFYAAAESAAGGREPQPRPLPEASNEIIVRRARRSDRAAIAKFIEEAYGAEAPYKASPRWTWQFVDNPYVRPQSDELPIWIALDDDRVVGQVALQMGPLDVDGKTFEAGWVVDLMILPSYRGAGTGHRLHDAAANDADILVSMTMAHASRRIGLRRGYIPLVEVHQLTRWVRLDAASVRRYLLVRTIHRRWAHRAARLGCSIFRFHQVFPRLANPLLRLRDFVKQSARVRGSTSIVEVDSFGSEIDELWQRTQGDYPVIFCRDAQFLNWRFVNCPELRYRRFVAERDGRTVGYVVLRRADPVEFPQGVIVDLYASREDTETLDELIRHSLAFFGDSVSAMDCGTSIAEFQAVLRRHGFFRTYTHHPTCICRDSAPADRLAQLKNDWFLSKADHDWDQIHVSDPDAAE